MNPPRPASDERSFRSDNAAAIPAAISDGAGDSHRWLAVYVIVRHPGRAPYWLSVGKAFVNIDGSLNVRLDANPIDGKLHIRRPHPREPPGASSQAAMGIPTVGATAGVTESAAESTPTSRSRTDAAKSPRSPKRAGR